MIVVQKHQELNLVPLRGVQPLFKVELPSTSSVHDVAFLTESFLVVASSEALLLFSTGGNVVLNSVLGYAEAFSVDYLRKEIIVAHTSTVRIYDFSLHLQSTLRDQVDPYGTVIEAIDY